MKIAIAGASGRMGRTLIEAVLNAPDMQLAAAFDRADSPAIDTDPVAFLGQQSKLRISADVDLGLSGCDVLIDFTRPEATREHLEACVKHGVAIVIGTTGLDATDQQALASAARHIPIVQAPNMSPGVNIAIRLIELATQALKDYDIEVIEAHHRHKVDAPSGTALAIGEAIAGQLGQPLKEIGVFAREGHTGPRQPGSIGFSTIRAGDIVGDHTVMFAGQGEQIEIRHRATSREHYADGSLRACRFLAGKTSGLFTMRDVLQLD
ncbi:MAG: 4-hydroxy-tetrahydrodipicolinate reductase [Lautropia sp.]|nr:4-hydroxy-tetrahydrodipicolinate reductase [Lautropia sp.]